MTSVNADIKAGDIVRLKEPYRPTDISAPTPEWKGFLFGIVAEIVSRANRVPTHVSLHLYDDNGQLYMLPRNGVTLPMYVDFHCSEYQLYKKAEEKGYCAK